MPTIISGSTGISGTDGTAATPAVQGTDTNTGIFFPAADTIAFAEGGTEVMRIDSAGNVGVGTTSPALRLDVQGLAIIGDGNDRTPDAFWSGHLNIRGSGYTGGISLNATGMWVGHNSGSRALIFAVDETERGRFDISGNFQFNSGYGSVATAFGCRAWVNFNGTGTVAIRSSGNISSITDLGTGDYTANFSTAMPDINYSQVWTAGVGAGVGLYLLPSIFFAPTVNGCGTRVTTDGAAITDAAFVCLAIFR